MQLVLAPAESMNSGQLHVLGYKYNKNLNYHLGSWLSYNCVVDRLGAISTTECIAAILSLVENDP